MTSQFPCPDVSNNYCWEHVSILLSNLYKWTGVDLVKKFGISDQDLGKGIFEAQFCLLSSDLSDDPVLNYGNQTALDLWEMSWGELTSTCSRDTAKPDKQSDRDELMRRVNENNFVTGYNGMRVSKSGKEFIIKDVTIWNLFDGDDNPYGRAAWFKDIEYI
ncbi:MAG: MEKHLA domain-containing protein [Nitrospinales bacterium]